MTKIDNNFLKTQILLFLDELNNNYTFIEILFIKDLISQKNSDLIFSEFKYFIENGKGEELIKQIILNKNNDDKCKKYFLQIIDFISSRNEKIKKEKLLYIVQELWFENSLENKNNLIKWIEHILKIILIIKKMQ